MGVGVGVGVGLGVGVGVAVGSGVAVTAGVAAGAACFPAPPDTDLIAMTATIAAAQIISSRSSGFPFFFFFFFLGGVRGGSFLPMAGSLAYMANSAEEAADYVRKIAVDKPDLIKLMLLIQYSPKSAKKREEK